MSRVVVLERRRLRWAARWGVRLRWKRRRERVLRPGESGGRADIVRVAGIEGVSWGLV